MEETLRRWSEAALAGLAGDTADDAATPVLRCVPLPVEASQRRFYRVCWQPSPGSLEQTFVVMSSPPALENNAQFVALAEVFGRHGIRVPRLWATDEARGYFVMSDLGERHFADVYHEPGPAAVMPAAIATLVRLQQVQDPHVPPYSRSRFVDEIGLYEQWFLQGLLEVGAPATLAGPLERLVEATQAQPRCCVHRDFHSRNLLLLENGEVGVVDFQDALVGPATYDLASLLRDCYYRLPEAEVARWREHYLAATTLPVDRANFARDLDMTALQRQLKAVGIFARLHLRDRRNSHLRHIVPVLERIRDLAALYWELIALATHLSDVLPAARRRLGALA
jgi:N-acetylmuramate 1-kinase